MEQTNILATEGKTVEQITEKPGTYTKSNIRKIPVKDLIANPSNPRKDYDLPSMCEDIRLVGRVTEPLHVQKETMYVLRGNRRLQACNRLLADPALPANIKANIEKLECFLYEGLSQREIVEIVFDHGLTKPLGAVETVQAVWALQKQMYSEMEIATMLYHLLGRYTNSESKIYEAQKLQGQARQDFLKSWLHGSLGQYIMCGPGLGEAVQKQWILRDTSMDRPLTDDEKKQITWTVTRDRIVKLNKAKKVDQEGTGYDPDTGGETFNKLLQSFIEKDAAPKGKGTGDKDRKYTVAEMISASETYKSKAMRTVYRHCAGVLKENEKSELDRIDAETVRMERLRKAALEALDNVDLTVQVGGTEVQGLISQLVNGTEVTFNEYVSRFLKPKPAAPAAE